MRRSFLPAISGYINRPRVDALIRKGLEYSLVLVVAGPGYGKTLSVANALRNADIRLIWMRASGIRTKAADFWADFIKAMRAELPEDAKKIEKLGFPYSADHFESFKELFQSAAERGKRLVLVADNYDRISDESVKAFLNNLIDSEIPNFTLYIICNVILPFAEVLPHSGQMRITDEQLAFTAQEAALFYQRLDLSATPELLERVISITGGWPMGLRLVCESNPDNPETFTSRSPVQIASDLYRQHYLDNYPKSIRSQLLLFSLLPQFSLEMTDESLEISRDELSDILMKHPFVSFDYGNGLFTFQCMYHDFLRQSQSLLSEDIRKSFLRRAGDWFSENEMLSEAMDCYWEIADYDSFLNAIYLMPKVRISAGDTNAILRRLEKIPREYSKSNPSVSYSLAFMYLNAAEFIRARELFMEVLAELDKRPHTESSRIMLGNIYATLSDISNYLNEDTGLEWMKLAYDQAPTGTLAHSAELLELGNSSAFFLPSNKAGELERMVDYYFEYARYADVVKNGCGFGIEYLFAGEAAYHREDMERAVIMLNSAIIKAQRTAQHDIICNAMWALGQVELYYGNHNNALAMLASIEDYINTNKLTGLYELRDCAIAYFYLWLDDLEKVPAWLGDTMTGLDDSPISFARRQLTSAYYLSLKGERTKAYAVLLQLESFSEHRGRWMEKFSLHVMKAKHFMAAHMPEDFEREFRAFYDMVYLNNLRLGMSNAGRDMAAMIDYLKKLDTSYYDMDWLGEVYADSLSFAKRLSMMRNAYKVIKHNHRSSVSLTQRETETLHFLAQGLTQKEIGRLMNISENTVKKHISKIYSKLGAVNRADAIHIATVNGLVDAFNS